MQSTTEAEETLRLYALLRADLSMPPGKLASQAGHAFLGAYLSADGPRRAAYDQFGLGTKVCLSVPNLPVLLRAFDAARTRGLPCFLVEDTGRNTTFHGVPTLSAVGIGPLFPPEAQFLRRYALHP